MYPCDKSRHFPLLSFEPIRCETCGFLYFPPTCINFSPVAVTLELGVHANLQEENGGRRNKRATNAELTQVRFKKIKFFF